VLREPTIQRAVAGGLDHQVLVWDGGGTTTALLVHGLSDAGATWARLVPHLPADLHVVAPDLRGHGGTARVGDGGYYYFLDYVRDLRDLVDAFARDRLLLIGHSMGGGIAALFTGAWPDAVDRLVLVEGLGVDEEPHDDGPKRLRRWVEEVRRTERSGRAAGRLDDLDDLTGKLRRWIPRLSDEHAAELAPWLARTAPDGSLRWLQDPLHRTRTPLLFQAARWEPFLRAITCPVLTVWGSESWYRLPDLPDRRAMLADHRMVEVPDAGHSVHLDAPEALGEAIGRFLAS